MFGKTATLFNYGQQNDEYAYTVINSVEVQPNYISKPTLNGVEDDTKCLLIIPFKVDETGIYLNVDGKNKYYKYPLQWFEDDEYFTLQTDIDFIVLGEHRIKEPNLNDLKNRFDNLWIINDVKIFYDIIPHFELKVN